MTTDPHYAHHVTLPGTETTETLADVLGASDGDSASEQLRTDLEQIRDAERDAERTASQVRLY